MRAAYTGNEALTFSDYMDLETGRTLLAEPGGVYDIMPASGRNVNDIPAPWFIPAGAPKTAKRAPEPVAADESQPPS